jgi:hypothetical protein
MGKNFGDFLGLIRRIRYPKIDGAAIFWEVAAAAVFFLPRARPPKKLKK